MRRCDWDRLQERRMHFEKFDESPMFRQQENKLHFAKLDDSPMFRQQVCLLSLFLNQFKSINEGILFVLHAIFVLA